ncbi:lasso peptide biosynthesis B2 protein [Amycolatopsis sp. NPDC005232]|uniref:lasso peptide biosynthesis B2 protein n=1 Tax=Amycolatopsis sp. NPDC005232 TaxID=3157027 RepID=UPI0033ADBE4C
MPSDGRAARAGPGGVPGRVGGCSGTSRQGVTWCHGAAADPVRLHAWLETDDREPVAEPPSTARFAVLRTIPVRDDGGETD